MAIPSNRSSSFPQPVFIMAARSTCARRSAGQRRGHLCAESLPADPPGPSVAKPMVREVHCYRRGCSEDAVQCEATEYGDFPITVRWPAQVDAAALFLWPKCLTHVHRTARLRVAAWFSDRRPPLASRSRIPSDSASCRQVASPPRRLPCARRSHYSGRCCLAFPFLRCHTPQAGRCVGIL